jgi:hypothetical protein
MNSDMITPPTGGWDTLGAQIAQRQSEAITYLNQIYKQLFNESIKQGCGNCYHKAFYRIQKYLYLQQQSNPSNNNDMPLPSRKYLLKPDRSLQTTFGGDTLTNDNITDEVAEKLLQAHPVLIKHFDRYPSESDKQVEPENKMLATSNSIIETVEAPTRKQSKNNKTS